MSKRVRLLDTKLINGGSEVDDPLDRNFERWFLKHGPEDSYIDIIIKYKWLIVIVIVFMMYFLYNYIFKKKKNI